MCEVHVKVAKSLCTKIQKASHLSNTMSHNSNKNNMYTKDSGGEPSLAYV